MLEERVRPLIVPIFIPNQGCPHRCVFCEQERITSQTGRPVGRDHVERVLRTAIRSKHFDPRPTREVAFYGGTFTRLSRERIVSLLEAVAPYRQEGLFGSIRVSTRPDAVEDGILELMKARGVRTVELGAQSMDDTVLSLSRRGHRAGDTARAVESLRRCGLKVGIQLMPGLPGDSRETFLSTVAQVIKLRPDMVRLYPAVVLKGTELCTWYGEGRYRPLGLDEAVDLSAESCLQLENRGIPVIRMGLMSSPSLLEEGQIVAGPWHPSFGFLVRSRMHHKRLEPFLPFLGKNSQPIEIRAPEREIPLVRGFRNRGLREIEEKTGGRIVSVKSDDGVPPGCIEIVRGR